MFVRLGALFFLSTSWNIGKYFLTAEPLERHFVIMMTTLICTCTAAASSAFKGIAHLWYLFLWCNMELWSHSQTSTFKMPSHPFTDSFTGICQCKDYKSSLLTQQRDLPNHASTSVMTSPHFYSIVFFCCFRFFTLFLFFS